MRPVVAASTLFIAFSAQASFFTGNDLLEMINGDDTKRSMAYGYIMGSFDVGDQVAHCAPPGVKALQLVDIVKKFLVDHPEDRHQVGDAIVTGVMAGTFPCAKRESDRGKLL